MSPAEPEQHTAKATMVTHGMNLSMSWPQQRTRGGFSLYVNIISLRGTWVSLTCILRRNRGGLAGFILHAADWSPEEEDCPEAAHLFDALVVLLQFLYVVTS